MFRFPMIALTRTILILVVAICIAGFAFPAIAIQNRNADKLESLFLPIPREKARALRLAKSSIEAAKYTEAINYISMIIEAESFEDYFIESPDDPRSFTGLYREVDELIRNLPAPGKRLYELKFAIQAEKLLADAITKNDINKIRDISTRYFHTKAGYEATVLLGHYYLDQGNSFFALLCFERTASQTAAQKVFEPQLSLWIATCHFHLDQKELAKQVLTQLARKMPDAQFSIGGEQSIELDTSDPLKWLTENVIRPGTSAAEIPDSQWIMHRGNAQRVRTSFDGMPLIHPRWKVPLINEPATAKIVENLSKEFTDKGLATMPAIHPLAVGNQVILRTPEKIFGIDFRTGKRQWVYPWDDEEIYEGQLTLNQAVTLQKKHLRQRLWLDSVHGQMSSNEKSLFFVDELGYASDSAYQTSVIGPNGQRFGSSGPRAVNKLVALKLVDESGKSVQGKLHWSVGGRSGDMEPKLAGAFFLGPPLPIQNELYVICEIQKEIRLAVIKADTGKLVWTQQLASVENIGDILTDGVRRLAGATPSYSNGVLVCPTSTGGVAAIDVSNRRLLWGFTYPRFDSKTRRTASMNRPENRSPGKKWIDSTVSISDNHVVLTPGESEYLYCLDLRTGKSKWKNIRKRETMLYVAGIQQDQIILVSGRSLKSIDLNDGSQKWESPIVEIGLPTGRGFMSQGYLYLPTNQETLAKIDLADGSIKKIVETDGVLGNLISHRGEVISLSTEWLSTYFKDTAALERVTKRLKEDPDDVTALALKGQLMINSGDYESAIKSLKRSFELGNRRTTLELLGRAMAGALQADFEKFSKITLPIESLITNPTIRKDYLRAKINGLIGTRQPVEAMRHMLEFISVQSESKGKEKFESIPGEERKVRWDRYVKATFLSLLKSSSEDQIKQLQSLLNRRSLELLSDGNAQERLQLNMLFGWNALIEKSQIEFAKQSMIQERFIECELIYTGLLTSSDPAIVGSARAGLARLYEVTGRYRLAWDQFQIVARDYADKKVFGELTGAQLIAQAKEQEAFQNFDVTHQWPVGKVEVEKIASTRTGFGLVRNLRPFRLTQSQWPSKFDLQIVGDTQKQVFIRDANGLTLRRFSMRAKGRAAIYYNSYYVKPKFQVNGHILVLTSGYDTMAVDLLKNSKEPEENVLWRISTLSDSFAGQSGIVRSPTIHNNDTVTPWGVIISTNTDGINPVGSSGWASTNGFCYLKKNELRCIDLLSGELLWQRTDIPLGASCIGDDNYVFVRSKNGVSIRQFRLSDGKETATFEMPDCKNQWTNFGNIVLSWNHNIQTGSGEVFAIDMLTRKRIWTEKVPSKTVANIVDQTELAILYPDGNLTIRNILTGKERLKTKIELAKPAKSVFVLKDEKDYFVVANNLGPEFYSVSDPKNDQRLQVQRLSMFTSMIDGAVYSLDAKSGKSNWSKPAVVKNYSLSLHQPLSAPGIIFARRKMPNGRGRNRDIRPSSEFICLDKRLGKIVASKTGVMTDIGYSRLVAVPNENAIKMELGTEYFKINFQKGEADESPKKETPAKNAKEADQQAMRYFRRTAETVAMVTAQAGVGKLNNPSELSINKLSRKIGSSIEQNTKRVAQLEPEPEPFK